MIYGYARVSTNGQGVETRVAHRRSRKSFREVASGAGTDRAHLHRLLKILDEGDELLVTRHARLARSTHDLLNTLAVTSARKAAFRSSVTHGPIRQLRTGT
jgi:DNA invertase Pin-like site-specific DNA recombinase